METARLGGAWSFIHGVLPEEIGLIVGDQKLRVTHPSATRALICLGAVRCRAASNRYVLCEQYCIDSHTTKSAQTKAKSRLATGKRYAM